jgi:hypothetical protein
MSELNKPTPQKFDKFVTEWILIRELRAHPTVQRPFNESWAQKIADAFDPDKFRPLDVIKSGQSYLVFAGQHRLAAARLALGENQRVPCHVHNEVPIERQAEICLGVDNMLGWKRIDSWKLRVIAKEEVPIQIEALLRRYKLRVDKSPGEGIVRAVAALEAVYKRCGGDDGLGRTLSILGNAWGRNQDAYDALLIRGLGFLVHRLNGQLEDDELARRLSKGSGPERMIGAARDYAKVASISVDRAMADKILNIYNKGRRTGKVEL